MKQLVRLRMRPSRDGNSFAYFIDYKDENGKRRRMSLGHTDRQEARRQQAQKERELRLGIPEPPSLKLSDFMRESLTRTGDQIRESTREEYSRTMMDFIRVVGDKDLQRVSLQDGERYRQVCLDEGNSPATVVMKLAGHANFSTTHRFHLRVRDDMIDRARKVSIRATSRDLARAPFGERCPRNRQS